MARSKQGGAWGFLRGKVGGMSYSILGADKSGSGKREQIIRSLPESVKNPQTAGQTMQRMKLAPAQKFYTAFSELLSNAFQGIPYGDASRRYFMALAMRAEGPYVQKGVDRFIPAAYVFSQGSLPSIGIEPFEGGATVITLANEVAEGTTKITNAEFAELLGVGGDYQLTVAVVNNVNGVFVPSYIPFDERLQIANLPEGTLAIADGKVTINPAALGLDMSAMVACCVVLSVQDASGAWLRSTQEMIISNELRSSLYGPDALENAIYSYQSGNTVNGVNSAWYYNLGLAQAWNGKLITVIMDLNNESLADNKNVVMGIQQIDGRITRTVFATSTDDEGLIIFIENGRVTTSPVATVAQFKELHQGAGEYNNIEQWQDSYAAQLNVEASNGETSGTRKAYLRKVQGYKFVVNEYGQLVISNNKIILDDEGQLAIAYTYVQQIASILDSVIASIGSESVSITGINGDGSLTLPAKEDKTATTYNIANGVATPAIEEYSE